MKNISNRVKCFFSKYKKIKLSEISIKYYKGGFTDASKFIIDDCFLKVADVATHPVDAYLIESEAKVYSILHRLGLTGVIFPDFKGYINHDGIKVLIIDYLSQVTWGGPWNTKTIKFLDSAINKLHSTNLTDFDNKQIIALADSIQNHFIQKVQCENERFLNTWDNQKLGFKNFKNAIYFKGNKNLPKQIIQKATQTNPNVCKKLIMQDLNFANIGFSDNQAFFVDPVYITLGDPNFDKTVIGVNILQQTGDTINPKLRKLVIKKFFVSKPILANLIKYYTIVSAMHLSSNESNWQKFHQECAVVALTVFNKL